MNNLPPGELETRKRNKLIRRTYRTNGPNHVIHVDQYDKLASFGFLASLHFSAEELLLYPRRQRRRRRPCQRPRRRRRPHAKC